MNAGNSKNRNAVLNLRLASAAVAVGSMLCLGVVARAKVVVETATIGNPGNGGEHIGDVTAHSLDARGVSRSTSQGKSSTAVDRGPRDECAGQPDDTPCTDDGNDCTDDICETEVCTHPFIPVGTPCGDPGSDQCDEADTCDGVGDCLPNYALSGTPCDDGLACNIEEQCDGGGSCIGGHPVDCAGFDTDCVVVSCDPVGGEGNCDIFTPINEGGVCDDYDACTYNGLCRSGICTGIPINCPLGESCWDGECDGGSPLFEWVPVDATVSHSIVDHEITLFGSDGQVTLELILSGWGDAAGSPDLIAYQATVDATYGYSSGSGVDLAPVGGCCPGDPSGAFINTQDLDYVFYATGDSFPSTSLVNLDFTWAVACLYSVSDTGQSAYGGALVLGVPSGAAGTYTIGFDTGSEVTLMDDEFFEPITPLTFSPALITVQDDLYVDASATGPTHDGSNWCNAFVTLQDALSIAGSGSTIKVADGTYKPDQGGEQTPGDREARFQLVNGITIEGGYAGCGAADPDERDIDLYETILSGDLNGDDFSVSCTQDSPDCDSLGGLCLGGSCILAANNSENSYRLVIAYATDMTAVLDGLIITAGNGNGPTAPNDGGGGMRTYSGTPTVRNCTFTGNYGVYGGGMVNVEGGSPLVTNCRFIGNSATYGGGMDNHDDSNPTVTDCTFSWNSAEQGGGLYNNTYSHPTFIRCTFSRNSADWGGGMLNWLGSDPTVTSCTFYKNSAEHGGGGMRSVEDCHPTVTNCVFVGNTAEYAGGMHNWDNCSPIVTNCAFTGNSTLAEGGGMQNYDAGSPTVINCTFSGNSAGSNGGGVWNWNSTPALSNCVLWGNDDSGGTDESAQIWYGGTGTPTASYTLIQGLSVFEGNNNIDGDPLFVDPAGPDKDIGTMDDDLRLSLGSPCIDAADDTAVPLDSQDLDDDADTSERTPLDLRGDARFFNDPDTVDTGVADSPDILAVVDMGAYEYFPDCNSNGLADACDLDCAALGGECDLPGCGQSPDCDDNDAPDECDIANCVSNPDCDDCNLNGVPDWCDIDSGASLDTNFDEIPDECVAPYTGSVNWTGNVWGLPDEGYPDNDTSVAGLHVTLHAGTDMFLDDTVVIEVLRILPDAALSVTQNGAGDLTVVEAGGIVASGTMNVANDRAITVTSGPVTIGAGGLYQGVTGSRGDGCDPGVDVCASLSSNDVTVGAGVLNNLEAGTMVLEGAMSVTTADDFVLDGRGAISCEDVNPRGSSDTPPILRVRDTSSVSVQGDMCVWGSVDVVYDSTVPLELGGNFDNQCQYPECFDWSSGGMLLGSGASRSSQEAQVFEVAGRDLGQAVALENAEFAIGALEIASYAEVTFTDSFDNDGEGQGGCTEALYVGELFLHSNSSIILENCRLYYDTLIKEADVTVTTSGCGELVKLCPAADPPDAEDPAMGKNRYISLVPGSSGQQTALRVTLISLPSEFSIYEGTHVWVGEPVEICENSGQSTPPPEGCGPAWVPGGPALTMWSANLQATQYCQDFGSVGLLHVTDCEIVPGAIYTVQAIDCTCDPGNEASYSDPLLISTSPWGNICGPWDVDHWSPPDTSVDVTVDVTACLEKFKNAFGAPIKARADVDPNTVDWKVNISTDVTQILDAFKGQLYPFAGPGTCPP